MPQVGKDRLYGSDPSTINQPATFRVDFLFHFLGVALLLLVGATQYQMYLSGYCSIRIPQASGAQLTGKTYALGAAKFDCSVGTIPDMHIGAIAMQPLPGRAYAVGPVFSKCEILCCKQIRPAFFLDTLFAVPLFVFVAVGKTIVPFTKLGVGNIAVYVLICQHLHVGFSMKPNIRSKLDLAKHIRPDTDC